ncbi:MAG: xanthine dehydrogenase family protein molybdopterin-binding subunit [Oculatellaceae cyanobacterium Prado106]|nr:xanthine dehydrogenase family protein molybdopterin-binding subunit [Oculatellaceae cyanobacterium Prado106]
MSQNISQNSNQNATTSVVGTAASRKDGRAKVTGTATYAAEHQLSGLVHGYVVTSPIAKGRIRSINTTAAAQAPGVIAVYTHQNSPQIFKPANNWMNSKIYEARLPLSDDQIHYAGQVVGMVVADTLERARHAAHLVQVDYEPQAPQVNARTANYQPSPPWFGEDFTFNSGSFSTGSAEVTGIEAQIEATYTTEMELHAPMEPHATIAHWQGKDAVTIYEPSQYVLLTQKTYAELLGLAVERVRILSPYIGGGFGSKAFPWPPSILCAAAARDLGRPLKVVNSRRQMTANAGHRSETEQTLKLSATAAGKLVLIEHLAKSCTSPVDVFPEPCTIVTPVMYAAPNIRLEQQLAVMNVGTPTFMRAPGEAPGMWALESAMDELAWTLKIDPVQLRIMNQTQSHQRKNLPFSAKQFTECLEQGAERFGWQGRSPEPRSQVSPSQTQDDLLVGWGMAAATFPGYRGATSAKVRLLPDGTAHVLSSGNDMGTGAYTVVGMTAADALGLPLNQIRVELGDSLLPDGGIAGGSQMTASLTPSVALACQEVLKAAEATTAAAAFEKLRQTGRAAFEATASTAPGEETKQFAFNSWGAHFCEVTVDELLGRLRITRWVSVMNIGRVLNPKTAASQVRGGIIMGMGQALMEECHFDPNTGFPVVYDLATYHFPAHADIPRIEVAFVGEPDLNFNPMGVRGVGEIGITGVAAAIANAVYHATGKRIRSLPILPEKLL